MGNLRVDGLWPGLLFLVVIADAFAHGVMENPPSRNWLCGAVTRPEEVDLGTAKHPACSTAFAVNPPAAYNYMAVLTHSLGRSEVAPLPQHVCGFAGEFWKGAETPWDVPMAWPANPISEGPHIITWNITWGPHFDDTRDFRYWITKSGFVFSSAKALTWEDFETDPFCIEEYDDWNPAANPDVTTDKPNSRFHTRCMLPPRSGHHVIYGEWGRTGPTLERFHGCIDVDFGVAMKARHRDGHVKPKHGPQTGKETDLLGRIRKSGASRRRVAADSSP